MYPQKYLCFSVLSQKPSVYSYEWNPNDWNSFLFCSCITPAKLGCRQAALDLQKSN